MTKRRQMGNCAACTATPLPLMFAGTSRFGGVKDIIAAIPWKWIIPTAIISAGLSGYLTWKMSSSIVKSKVALKVSGLDKELKRKKKRKKSR